MTFAAPASFVLLLLLPVLVALAALWLIWRYEARREFGLRGTPFGRATIIPIVLILLAITLAIFAAARPQAGERDVRVEERGIDLAIVLDVSNSMLAEDAEPTRLARAQAEIIALLDRLNGDRVAFVVFAGEPLLRSPLTSDLAALQAIVQGVDQERGLIVPGSDLGAAVREAQQAVGVGDAQTRAILLISDGEERTEGVTSAVAAANAAGIIVYSAGVGTPVGAPVREIDPDTLLPRTRVDDSGAAVITRRDEAALEAIAVAGGGRYVALEGEGRPLTGLGAEFDELGTTAFDSTESSRPIEWFQVFAAAALALVAVELLWQPLRRREAWRGLGRRLWPVAATGIFAGAVCTSSLADANRRGNDEYAAGRHDAAISYYTTAVAIDASRDELYYNTGNAYDASGDYARAIDETKRSLPIEPTLESAIEYALGNHYAGANRLADALEAYKRALLADPNDAHAKHNLEVIGRRLTPVATPTPTATPPPEPPDAPFQTPIPDDPADGQGDAGTPAAGDATPASGGEPTTGTGELSGEALERALADALEGIDQEFTEEEANRVLDLLAEQNRRQVQQDADASGAPVPDY